MFKNYFIIALRNFRRNKLYSSLNVLGLSVGIACFMLLSLYIRHELTYDRFHSKNEQLYRAMVHLKIYDREVSQAATSAALANRLKKDFPEVDKATRFNGTDLLLTHKEKKHQARDIAYVDADFVDMFDFKFLHGNPQTALRQPRSLVVTESLAKKLFRTKREALNKVVEQGNGKKLVIRGVIQDVPTNSTLKFNGLLSFNTLDTTANQMMSWGRNFLNTYVLLKPGTNHKAFNKKLHTLQQKLTKEGYFSPRYSKRIALQPLKEAYLEGYKGANEGAMKYIYIFAAITGFILLIACINYMNMATSGAMNRAKEVGIRKVVGSHRSQLIKQFMLESFVLVTASTILGLVMVELVLPYFIKLSGKQLVYSLLEPSTLLLTSSLIVSMSFLSGLYPAFFMSSFNTVTVLKGKFVRSTKTARLRKGLVVFQFSLSAIILISTWISFQQFSFMIGKDLGYEHTQMYIIPLAGEEKRGQKAKNILNQLQQNPNVTAVTRASSVPGSQTWNNNLYDFMSKGEKTTMAVDVFVTDRMFPDFMKLKLLKGEKFSKKLSRDSVQYVLVNQEFVKKAGWKLNSDDPALNPVGQKMDKGKLKVIGVFKNIHIRSLHYKIKPMMVAYKSNINPVYLYAKLRTKNLPQTLTAVRQAYQKIDKKYPFDGFFLDQNFAKEYNEDQKRVKLFTIFSLLTVLVACLGLFGLASFTITQRTKEIGIRKVLGASLNHIMQLVTKDFILLVLIANVIAIPVVLYFTHQWLDSFAYAAAINYLWVFVLSGVVAIGIAMLTISWHVVKATQVNPVEVLKDE